MLGAGLRLRYPLVLALLPVPGHGYLAGVMQPCLAAFVAAVAQLHLVEAGCLRRH